MRTEPRGWKAKPITGIKSTALRKEETVVCLYAVQDKSLKEGAVCYVDPLLVNNCEISSYTTAIPK
jgi:hypothetical protein